MSMSHTTAGVILAVFSLMLLGGCDEGPGTTERSTAEREQTHEPEPPETPKQACMPHPASQIVGDWDASGSVHVRDDEGYSFHSDGTYQHTWSSTAPAPGLDQPTVTRTVTGNGSYSYVAETCLLTWSPGIANITFFVAWNGSNQFCAKFNSGYRSSCVTTFNRS